ncbi:acylcarnitine hydrolase-like [Cylas formicarius]|uniref:acylcarnitine hydrolase-like n=1 Tax=Cylas formicarius TaxID=197179 RepID=UPI00295839B9|nr:acylcarnitine hydrolase-like [Cylas formicarius]
MVLFVIFSLSRYPASFLVTSPVADIITGITCTAFRVYPSIADNFRYQELEQVRLLRFCCCEQSILHQPQRPHQFSDIIVDTADGKVRGSELVYQDKSIYAFRGIPFAKAPIGNLRFQAPVPAEPWEGVFDSNNVTICCIQMDDGSSTTTNQSIRTIQQQETEDCLRINVFAPKRNNTELLPVMFSIYGGGFKIGCATDNLLTPYKLVNDGVIVVLANYRLGLFGWLSTGDDVVLGNAGFKDQLLALKWVQKNIEQFGGDPTKVTILGQSAGAISVGAHIVNKKSAGLYRAAICQSGSALFNIALVSQYDPKEVAYDLAKFIDPTISERNTSTEIKDFLQSQPVDVLSQAFTANPKLQFDPIICTETSSSYKITLPNLLTFLDLDAVEATALEYDTNSLSLIPSDLKPLDGVDLNEVANVIKETYVGKSGSFSTNLAAVVEYNSDTMFIISALKHAELQSKYTAVYFYEFSYEGLPSLFHINVEGLEGYVAHGVESYYLFPNLIIPSFPEDNLTGDRLVRLWTNFAKTLNPTPDLTDPLLNVTWPQVLPADIQYLNINKTLDAKRDRRAKEFAMWNQTYYTYGKQPFIGF